MLVSFLRKYFIFFVLFLSLVNVELLLAEDYQGVDWTPANGETICGEYTNIGTFTVAGGTTVYVCAESSLSISANNVYILGTLNANGKGYPGGKNNPPPLSLVGEGPGAGCRAGSGGGGGGGYGGKGGGGNDGYGKPECGGEIYGSLTQPTDLGSGGGGSPFAYGGGRGGAGGGAIFIEASQNLVINGSVQANGSNGGTYAGGGSGGSIYLIADNFGGSGLITANGGNGTDNTFPGGGGGGRIAIYYPTSTYSGSIQTYGGEGFEAGESGTIYQTTLVLDADEDGVFDSEDNCLGTILPETIPTKRLLSKHYAEIDGDKIFETLFDYNKYKLINSRYSLTDTYGCSCEQILECKPGTNKGEYNYGCTEGTIKTWIKQKGWARTCSSINERADH